MIKQHPIFATQKFHKMSSDALLELQCHINNYAWGNPGSISTVAKLGKNNIKDIEIDTETPYSEFWMGTHPNGPSVLKNDTSISLKDFIAENPNERLGADVAAEYANDVPYLLKVLSIGRALSIQAHPNKSLAADLHSRFPEIYKDGNHKPEMAIAVTEFSALCGFRTLEEIHQSIQEVEELGRLIGDEVVGYIESIVKQGGHEDRVKAALRRALSALIDADTELVSECIESHLKAYPAEEEGQVGEQSSSSSSESTVPDRFKEFRKVAEKFPGDSGCFVLYLLNLIHLKPGQGFYMGPNVPHAYLGGDCVECMACSDNVVRAGLTPKLKDKDTLLAMLTYENGPADEQVLEGEELDKFTRQYNPPIDEFIVDRTVLDSSGDEWYKTHEASGPSIYMVLSGQGNVKDDQDNVIDAAQGTVWFSASNKTVEIQSTGDQDLVVYRAYC